ncbi:MAG: alpha/beta fold hydrolase [Nocardioides sp.]
MPSTRRIASGDLELCVREDGEPAPGRASVVLVHGYPDQQSMWDPMVRELRGHGLHVVTYDVRGAGSSGVPAGRGGYRSELLVDDLAAVLAATVPAGTRAHLVGHDWGSVQLWDAVASEAGHPGLRGRIASFTSISGPSLDHSAWLTRHPRGRSQALLRQGARSWYVGFFQVPLVPELMWRLIPGRLRRSAERAPGIETAHWGDDFPANAIQGVNLYRANVPGRMIRPRRVHTGVPVLVVHPTADKFLTDVFLQDLDRICDDVRVVEVEAGHWFPRTHPRQAADLVLDQVEAHR